MSARAPERRGRRSGRGGGDVSRAAARRRAEQPLEQRILVTVTLCLLAYGAVMVYSASSARNLLQGQDGTAYLVRYLAYGAVGLVLMHVLSRRGLEPMRRLTPLLLGVSLVCLLAVLVPGLGVSVNGARRWLGAGPLQFQPSELAKLALVLYGAQTLAADRGRLRTLKGVLLSPLALVAGVDCLLLVVEPDLGTALVIAFTIAAMLIAAGAPLKYLAVVGGAVACVIGLLAIAEPYRMARLTSFLNPWADPTQSGFQAVQGQIALGSGGLFGVGLGESVQKVFYLPEAHTDFILAVIGEELGVIGVGALLCLYGLLGYAGLRAAKAARSAYEKLLASGIVSLILCQAVLNVFVVLGLAPLTGVPLPFISYGASNLIVLLAGMGLLLGIASGRGERLRVVDGGSDADRDRRRRDRGARGAGAGRRREAAG